MIIIVIIALLIIAVFIGYTESTWSDYDKHEISVIVIVGLAILSWIAFASEFADKYLFGSLSGYYGETVSGISMILCFTIPIAVWLTGYAIVAPIIKEIRRIQSFFLVLFLKTRTYYSLNTLLNKRRVRLFLDITASINALIY